MRKGNQEYHYEQNNCKLSKENFYELKAKFGIEHDSDLARKYCLSRERIRQIRSRLGIKAIPRWLRFVRIEPQREYEHTEFGKTEHIHYRGKRKALRKPFINKSLVIEEGK